MEALEKYKLAFVSLLVGLALLIYSWFSSYPLSIKYPGDVIFNNVSPYYWLSLPFVLGSLYLIGVFSKSLSLKCLASIGIVTAIYSLSYFYFSMTTADSVYFRGVTDYFIQTQNLDPTQFVHLYLQWPSFFLIADITTSVTGLSVVNFEFFLYAVIGSLMAAALYLYASKIFRNTAFLVVVAFFIAMFYYFNYQAVPFSLAFSLLLILFVLETVKRTPAMTFTMILLFSCIAITHFFVALFFVLYLLFRTIINRSKAYARFFLLAICIYSIVQLTIASTWLGVNLTNLFRLPPEYSFLVSTSLTPATTPFQSIAHTISTGVILAFVAICVVGFLFVFLKRKLRAIDAAIFLAGVAYSAIGLVIYTLGSRTISVFFIPIALGLPYLFQTKVRKYLIGLVLILLVLFVFVPIRNSSLTYPITFQTKEDFTTANFMIKNYDWNSNTVGLTDLAPRWFIIVQIQGNPQIDTDLQPRFGLSNLTSYDYILYSIGLESSFKANNISNGSQQIIENFDVTYNSGLSYLAQKPS